ncbi:MAG: hypothetical protein M5U34_28875 [Chloroflexi bacterium]|nr:hypothetical protein [Chloroflexota bacterium]
MKQILIIHLNDENDSEVVTFLDQEIQSSAKAAAALQNWPAPSLRNMMAKWTPLLWMVYPPLWNLAPLANPHEVGQELARGGGKTAVVDGSGIRAGLERWAIILADRAQPGIFAQKHIPHGSRRQPPRFDSSPQPPHSHVRYADPVVYFGLPQFPRHRQQTNLQPRRPWHTRPTRQRPFRRIKPQAGSPGTARAEKPFAWADVLAGDIGAIRRYAPANLKRKTVVVECASPEDVADMRQRGVSILVTLMPSTDGEKSLGRWPAAAIEAMLVALRPDPDAPSTKTPTSTSWQTSSGRPASVTCNRPKPTLTASPSSSIHSTSASSITIKRSAGRATYLTNW